jgi:GT2 family glycosyltransferase
MCPAPCANTSDAVAASPAVGLANASTPPALSLVTATLSQRPRELKRLIDSIDRASGGQFVEIVLVDQDPARRSEDATTEAVSGKLKAVYIATSERGLSRARNRGITQAQASIVTFPDDDSWYADGTLRDVLQIMETRADIDILCGMQVTESGAPSMLRWQRRAGPVGRFNVVRTAISSTMFVRRQLLLNLHGFAEDLGVGSDGWFGAGEETDLILRALSAGSSVYYDPAVKVYQNDDRPTDSASFRRKRVSYGCGMGEILRRHSYPHWYLAYLVLRKLGLVAILIARGQRTRIALEILWTRGFIAGISRRKPGGL